MMKPDALLINTARGSVIDKEVRTHTHTHIHTHAQRCVLLPPHQSKVCYVGRVVLCAVYTHTHTYTHTRVP